MTEEKSRVLDPEHLGDGAYVSTDWPGGVWLGANHHTARHVYLETNAVQNLVDYCRRLGMKIK